jgi:ethanolamine utilization protein EutJ
LLTSMKARVEQKLGFALTSSASGYPPGVPPAEVRATANVLHGAGLDCTGLIDEPTAANNVLKIRDGAIVDVGGGTTGIAIFKNGEVVYTADEPTGGTHFSLVIAGATDTTFEEAEAMKKNPKEQTRLFSIVRPVMEKVGSIINRHIEGQKVDKLYLVGGTCAYPGMDVVIQEYTGIETVLPGNPLFVTPLGIAMNN